MRNEQPPCSEEVRQTIVGFVPYTRQVNLVVLKGDVIILLKPEIKQYINPHRYYACTPEGVTETPHIATRFEG